MSLKAFRSKTAPVGFDGEFTTIIFVRPVILSSSLSSGWKFFSFTLQWTTLPPASWTQGSYKTQAGSSRITSSFGFRHASMAIAIACLAPAVAMTWSVEQAKPFSAWIFLTMAWRSSGMPLLGA